MRPDRSGRLAPADVVDLLDEISALLREQGGNQALELTLRDLSMNLQSIQDQLSRAQQTATSTDPTSLLASLADRITDALAGLGSLQAPEVKVPDRVTAELSPNAVELLRGLAPKQDGDVLAKLVEKLDALDFRMKGGGKAFGSSGPSNIADNPSRELGRVTTVGGDKVATQTTLESVVTELQSVLADIQGKRDGTETEAVYTSSPVAAKVAAGKFFLMSSSISVAAGTEATWSIANPSGSGKVIYIIHVSAATDQTAQIRFDVYKNSTITGGTARTPWSPNFAVVSTSVATVRDGAAIRSGGTALEAKIAVVRDDAYEFEGLVVVPPGTSLQVTGVVPGALSAQQLTVGARWYEE